jgi:hypothetical protein
MSARPNQITQFATTKSYAVDAAQTVTIGMPVTLSTDDTHVKQTSSGTGSNVAIGIALRSSDGTTGVSGAVVSPPGFVDVLLFGPILPMTVGTGGTTMGKQQVTVSNGITDGATAASSGSTINESIGVATQTGVAGDSVGVVAFRNTYIST